ncbi:Uncharacterised protein [Chlamydia trachomatis]|nr:Uncharacterised protein [Chlamydia trachomatis]
MDSSLGGSGGGVCCIAVIEGVLKPARQFSKVLTVDEETL